jgi:hypothetical protein
MDNIKTLLKLYENLHALAKPLAELLSNVLPSLSEDNWWKICVQNKLEERDLRILKKKGVKQLDELDVGLLLKILINNWYELTEKYNERFNTKKKKLTTQVKEIRNFAAHPTEKEISSADFISYFERLKIFAEFIGTNMDYSVEMLYKSHEIEDNTKKRKLFELINAKVFIPAIKCSVLNTDIKESVEDTQKRLNNKTTSNEIYDFFYDALDARRGKQVYFALKDANLLSFEDIINDFCNIYWGNA